MENYFENTHFTDISFGYTVLFHVVQPDRFNAMRRYPAKLQIVLSCFRFPYANEEEHSANEYFRDEMKV